MRTLIIKSLPIRDVLENIADQLGGKVMEDCEVLIYEVPKEYGSGHIMGANFPNGLAWLQYVCRFKEDIEIRFTVNKIHPLKMIYNLGAAIIHTFANSDMLHTTERYENLIVASSEKHGHVLKFMANSQIKLNSVEINRLVFNKYWACDVEKLDSKLKNAIKDVNASYEHLISGSYSLRVAQVFKTIKSFGQDHFIRKMFLASKSFELIAQQLSDYAQDEAGLSNTDLVSLEILRDVEELLEKDLKSFATVRALSQRLKVTENKLQKIFKENTGLTGNEYIKNKRMNAIVDLLENSQLSIGDISKLVGIDSASYLSKIFKDKYDISPKEFRNRINSKELTLK